MIIEPFELLKLFRTMSGTEHVDAIYNGEKAGGDTVRMDAKRLAESFTGWLNGVGSVSKFYVVSFDVDDAVAKVAYKEGHLDEIGYVRAIEVADLNGKTEVEKVNSIKVECK